MKLLFVFTVLITACVGEYTRYDRYKVFEVIPKDYSEIQEIKQFKDENHFDLWSKPHEPDVPVTIMVAPEKLNYFISTLNTKNIRYKTIIDDVQTTITAERIRQEKSPKPRKGKITFTEFHRYDVIQDYLIQLAEDFPDIVSYENYGTSYEGRQLSLVRIASGGSNKPTILIEGGIHGNEWISPATVLYVIDQLVRDENYSLIENTDWILIPVLNPDGYEYTQTTTRLWRKTRSRGVVCDGVDGNRNFDYQWGGRGSSTDECSQNYAGPFAFSEPELTAFSAVVERYSKNIKLYLSVHSYGQYIIYPWSWTTVPADDEEELDKLAAQVGAAIESVNGTTYRTGNSVALLSYAAGCSDDWVKGVAGVELTFVIELPGGGSAGFDPPPSRIIPVGIETWEGIRTYQQYINNKFGNGN